MKKCFRTVNVNLFINHYYATSQAEMDFEPSICHGSSDRIGVVDGEESGSSAQNTFPPETIRLI